MKFSGLWIQVKKGLRYSKFLLHRHGFGQVSGLVDVAPTHPPPCDKPTAAMEWQQVTELTELLQGERWARGERDGSMVKWFMSSMAQWGDVKKGKRGKEWWGEVLVINEKDYLFHTRCKRARGERDGSMVKWFMSSMVKVKMRSWEEGKCGDGEKC